MPGQRHACCRRRGRTEAQPAPAGGAQRAQGAIAAMQRRRSRSQRRLPSPASRWGGAGGLMLCSRGARESHQHPRRRRRLNRLTRDPRTRAAAAARLHLWQGQGPGRRLDEGPGEERGQPCGGEGTVANAARARVRVVCSVVQPLDTPPSSNIHTHAHTPPLQLGGKGANLAEMCSIGLSVPPGLTITTDTCAEFHTAGGSAGGGWRGGRERGWCAAGCALPRRPAARRRRSRPCCSTDAAAPLLPPRGRAARGVLGRGAGGAARGGGGDGRAPGRRLQPAAAERAVGRGHLNARCEGCVGVRMGGGGARQRGSSALAPYVRPSIHPPTDHAQA